MAMVVTRVIDTESEGDIVSLAYNRARREIYSAADGDKVIKVWDSRTGQLLRTQQGHKGMVTCVIFSNTIRLLFSGSIDSTVGIWTEKGVNLQMTSVGGPVFSLAWDDRRRFLIVGGHSVIHIFKVDLGESRKLSQQQRSVASGLKDVGGADMPQILRRVYQPLRGPDLCHSEVVKCIVVTETGKIMSGGFDKAICIYEFDKLDKPKEAFQIKRKCHTAAIVSMAYDHHNNCVLTGSIDGSMKVWSVEGRPLDHFENINDQPVCVAYVPTTHMYWASGRFGRLLAYDPRAPSNVTEYVRDANGLDRFKVTLLFTPLGTDLLLGGTHNKQLIIWQHEKTAAYRMFKKHEDWVEALVVVPGSAAARRAAIEAGEAGLPVDVDDEPEPGYELAPEIFSAGADGKVLRWQLDAEENCDIYDCIEETQLHEKNIYCITYSPDLDCIITGGEDKSIRLHYLSRGVHTFNDVPLPTMFQEHEGRVTGLCLLPNRLLASCSYDRTLRIWDLSTMKPVSVLHNAHDTPIQCLEYCKELEQFATCGMGNKVKIWDASKPAAVKLKLVLNHADADTADSDDEEGDGKGRKPATNMTWLTRSDLHGLAKATNPLVDEAIRKASKDTPEVTQVRWLSWRRCWVTAADDDMIRLWSPEGIKMHQFAYNGGSVQTLYADNVNQLLVASMLDKACYVYDVDDPLPRAVYTGHTDVVRAVSFIEGTGCHVTASWDKSLRLWFAPGKHGRGNADEDDNAASSLAASTGGGIVVGDDDEEDEDHFVSSYEKAHPLEIPRALTEANQWQILKAIGVVDDDKQTGKKGRARTFKMDETYNNDEPDHQGVLSNKLNDLGKELLAEINSIARQRKTAMETLDTSSITGSAGDRHVVSSRKGSRPVLPRR